MMMLPTALSPRQAPSAVTAPAVPVGEVETDDVESINKEVNERKALLKKRK